MSSKHVSNWVYLGVFFALMVGTFLTITAAGIDMGRPTNIAVGLAIAVTKATLVALFFMHLKFETKLIFGVALFPVALFLILVFALMPDVAFGGTIHRPHEAPHGAPAHGGGEHK